MDVKEGKMYCASCKKETEDFHSINIRNINYPKYIGLIILILLSLLPVIFWLDLLTIDEYSNRMIMKLIMTLLVSWFFWKEIRFHLILRNFIEKNWKLS